MKTMTKIAAGALVACGIAIAATAPADAGVRIGIGLPIVAAAPVPAATCYDMFGNPYYCGYPGYYGYAPGVVSFGFGGGHDHWHGGYARGGDFHGGFHGGHR